MSTISVRIDNDLKKKMESYKHINWSEMIRQSIVKAIQNEQDINRAKAVLLNEKVRKKSSNTKNSDSTKIIRQFREQRYGPKNL